MTTESREVLAGEIARSREMADDYRQRAAELEEAADKWEGVLEAEE